MTCSSRSTSDVRCPMGPHRSRCTTSSGITFTGVQRQKNGLNTDRDRTDRRQSRWTATLIDLARLAEVSGPRAGSHHANAEVRSSRRRRRQDRLPPRRPGGSGISVQALAVAPKHHRMHHNRVVQVLDRRNQQARAAAVISGDRRTARRYPRETSVHPITLHVNQCASSCARTSGSQHRPQGHDRGRRPNRTRSRDSRFIFRRHPRIGHEFRTRVPPAQASCDQGVRLRRAGGPTLRGRPSDESEGFASWVQRVH